MVMECNVKCKMNKILQVVIYRIFIHVLIFKLGESYRKCAQSSVFLLTQVVSYNNMQYNRCIAREGSKIKILSRRGLNKSDGFGKALKCKQTVKVDRTEQVGKKNNTHREATNSETYTGYNR